MVETSTATVFHGGGRRWFSRKAAENAEARKVISRRCECEDPDFSTGYPGDVCWLHKMPFDRLERIKHLLIVMFVRRQPASTSQPERADHE